MQKIIEEQLCEYSKVSYLPIATCFRDFIDVLCI